MRVALRVEVAVAASAGTAARIAVGEGIVALGIGARIAAKKLR